MNNVVIVESPAKAKTINKYLGSDYKVLASYGHIRDLPSKNGSVRPDDNFEMDWEVDPKALKRINEIVKALKGADHLYLATDPDRKVKRLPGTSKKSSKKRIFWRMLRFNASSLMRSRPVPFAVRLPNHASSIMN